jgi:competence protein ComEA
VNLAAPLVDGQQVVVPRRGPAGAGVVGAPASGSKVSLAAATVDQLDELPGIGPVTAQKIVDWRTTHGPFRSVEDLDDVPGIGPAKVEQLRDLVTP